MKLRGVPRRILMLSWEFPPRIVGGIARHVDELSRALAGAGAEVDVLTAHHPGAAAAEEIAAGPGRLRVLRAGPPPVHPQDFVCEIHQLGFALLERLLAEREADYDLVHAHDWLVAFAGRTLKHGLQLPLVATVHATERGRFHGIHTPTQEYIESVEWLLTYEAWRVICCSEAMRKELTGGLRVPPDKVRVVNNGIDPRRVGCADSPRELGAYRERWAKREERVVLFVGRLVREKGVEVLIDAMRDVLAARPEAKLVVAGGGENGHLRARAGERGIAHKVAFAGFVSEEDLARLYAVADVAVFPSLYEPFGIVALEAMAAGVPVVTSDAGGFREVVRHEETGIVTWANNTHSLGGGIVRVLSSPGLAKRLRQAARKEAVGRYSWEGIAEDTLAVYGEVLRGEGGGKAVGRRLPVAGPGVRARYLVAGEATGGN